MRRDTPAASAGSAPSRGAAPAQTAGDISGDAVCRLGWALIAEAAELDALCQRVLAGERAAGQVPGPGSAGSPRAGAPGARSR